MSSNPAGAGARPGRDGELCTCGRPAVVVYEGGRFGDTGDCGLGDRGARVDGVCSFCGDSIDHAHYATAEHAAGRDAPAAHDGEPQGGRCPLYRLRLADPLPVVRPGSVRRFDPVADRHERAHARLHAEVLAVLLAAGADPHGSYPLVPEPDGDGPETGDLDELVFDIVWFTRHALAPEHETSHDPGLAQDAVAVLLVMLRERLDALGLTPNPLDGLDAHTLIERVGGAQAWADTVAHDRPLLVARRVVRRALDPDTPHDIYRPRYP